LNDVFSFPFLVRKVFNMVNRTRLGSETAAQHSHWRSIGFWMAAVLVIYILFNAVRAVQNPVDFALYYGLPLVDETNTAFVVVYAIRALFLGMFGLALIVRMKWQSLALFALVAVIMPVGDALLVVQQGGASGTVIRHALTAAFLLLTWYFLQRWNRATASQ
jgi:hypothetical protein